MGIVSWLARLATTLIAVIPSAAIAAPPARPPQRPAAAPAKQAGIAPYCSGEYADSLLALSSKARELDKESYSYCIRNTAVYECLSYAVDGSVRRTRHTAIAHGTGFAYKQISGGTLMLTNHHVSEWPLVTSEKQKAGSVPIGCKKVSDQLRIVDNEADSFDMDDIALARVVADPQLDASVLKAKEKLHVIPWKLGRSSTLRERNVVQVRGFPLGVFQATNDGKVVSPYDHDTEREWDHDDFVIDAMLAHGGSGSPVLAVSCKTGEFEFVGMYHAGYSGANALNVAVGVDQLRDLMLTLKKKPKPTHEVLSELDPAARARLMRDEPSVMESFFPLGPLTAIMLRRSDNTLVFAIFPKTFPVTTQPIVVLEDRPAIGEFGDLGRMWFGGSHGLKEYHRADLDADLLGSTGKLLDGLRTVAIAAMEHRAAVNEPTGSREQFDRVSKLERALTKVAESRAYLAQVAVDLADRLKPNREDPVVSVAAVMTSTSIMSSAAAADLTTPVQPILEPTLKPRRPLTPNAAP
jgi:hypothetical protein